MIKNINSSSQQMSKSNSANKTILEQVYSLMNEPANRARLIDKARQKKEHSSQRPFGRMASDHISGIDKDENIYNDNEFYQALLKDFLATNESGNGGQGQTEDADDIYVDGADLGMTQKFLERRRKL